MGASSDTVAIGAAVQRLRERRGWTVYRLAQNAGMSDPYLRDIEGGKTKRIGFDILARLSRALGISLDDLAREVGLEEGPEIEQPVTLFGLDEPARRVAMQMGRALLEMQETYRSEATELRAAFHDIREARQAREDAEGWPDSE